MVGEMVKRPEHEPRAYAVMPFVWSIGTIIGREATQNLWIFTAIFALILVPSYGWLVAHIRPGLAFSDQTMIVWAGVLFMGLMGFLDDFIKAQCILR